MKDRITHIIKGKQISKKKKNLYRILLFQNKISSITFYSGQNTDELVKRRHVEVETRLLGGWINFLISGNNLSNSIKYTLFSYVYNTRCDLLKDNKKFHYELHSAYVYFQT